MRNYLIHGLLAFGAATQVYAAGSQYDFILQLPTKRPEWAEKLSPHLAGFSLEMDRWPDWAGKKLGKPNKYFNQLLRNLGERTGHMPFLRVGANSQDRSSVDLNVEVMNSTFPEPTENVPNPEANHVFIGRDFYALSGNLPSGTSFLWGLNLKSLNKTETVAQAHLLAEAFQGDRSHLTKHVKLVNVEIGNEPDFYGPTRTSHSGPYGNEWNPLNYTTTWVEFAKAISKKIEFGRAGSEEKPTLSPGALTGFNAPEWTPEGPLQAGILDDRDIRRKTSQFTEHSYSGGFSPYRIVQPGELMNKLAGETNSYANHGQPGLSNTVEGAIWTVDWMLLGASLGIERMHFHQGVGYRYNAIQPTDESDDGLNITRPHILPSYHAFLVVNEAIGKSGNAYISEIPTSNLTLTAYGIWEEKQLTRLVVLNTQVYLGNGEKPSINVNLASLSADRPKTVKLLQSETTTANTNV
ncbi:hypothetical protein G7Z17_g4714 [Cylindrodendrum hubeiense]|uniref:Beta-glucuronidase C-terminal domain-containing protein n=1 Tax=Cylindrodendrum hubeiense TaxID=595255 RepID=A0A9P5LIM0_9HYPO|nr:hypothetical protein G7Z17_g4714 [Cylindrodendrum hubeiense]